VASVYRQQNLVLTSRTVNTLSDTRSSLTPGHVVLAASDLKRLQPQWRALWRRCEAPPFQHPAWSIPWLAFAHRAVGHAIFRRRRLVALVVLVSGERGFHFAGHPLNDANELLAIDDEARAAVLRAAANAHAKVVLEHLAPEGPTVEMLRSVDGLHVRSAESEFCPTLPAGAETAQRLRARFERERRRAEITLHWRRPTASEVASFVERRLASWAHRGRLGELSQIERDPAFPRAFGVACGALAAEGLCHIVALAVNGRLAAEDLYLGGSRRPLLYMRSYERHTGLSSPGLHLIDAVRRSTPFANIDLGRGDEPYKLRLGARPYYRLTFEVSRASRS
jgi:CelD/BcsL family acetyltransferase involved in cellulose biosynthesis